MIKITKTRNKDHIEFHRGLLYRRLNIAKQSYSSVILIRIKKSDFVSSSDGSYLLFRTKLYTAFPPSFPCSPLAGEKLILLYSIRSMIFR